MIFVRRQEAAARLNRFGFEWRGMALWTIRVTSRIFRPMSMIQTFYKVQDLCETNDDLKQETNKIRTLRLFECLNDEEHLLRFESNNFEQFI